ncbi:hypothetical protein ACE1OE_11210 [Vibrio sp. E150_011]
MIRVPTTRQNTTKTVGLWFTSKATKTHPILGLSEALNEWQQRIA